MNILVALTPFSAPCSSLIILPISSLTSTAPLCVAITRGPRSVVLVVMLNTPSLGGRARSERRRRTCVCVCVRERERERERERARVCLSVFVCVRARARESACDASDRV